MNMWNGEHFGNDPRHVGFIYNIITYNRTIYLWLCVYAYKGDIIRITNIVFGLGDAWQVLNEGWGM